MALEFQTRRAFRLLLLVRHFLSNMLNNKDSKTLPGKTPHHRLESELKMKKETVYAPKNCL